MASTLAQERALAITPKCTSSLSITCSSFLIYEVYCDYKRKRSNAIQRVLVGMSLVDICASFGWFLSTWAVPQSSGFAFASGNQATCNFQGFLLQLAIGAPLYNSSLALFYLMVIKYNWSNDMLVNVEKIVHGLILSFAVGTSIVLLPLEQYNHIGAVCWVIGEPNGCGHSTNIPSNVPCNRGDYAYLYGLALFYGPLWICVVACITSMIIIYFEVKKTHERLHRYGRRHQDLRRSASDTSLVATQALLYTLSFFFTWMPSTIWSIAHWFNVQQFWLDFLAAFCEPLQGFINLWIFVRRRPQSREKIRVVLAKILPCCRCWLGVMEDDDDHFRGRHVSGQRSSVARTSRGSVRFSTDTVETPHVHYNTGVTEETVDVSGTSRNSDDPVGKESNGTKNHVLTAVALNEKNKEMAEPHCDDTLRSLEDTHHNDLQNSNGKQEMIETTVVVESTQDTEPMQHEVNQVSSFCSTELIVVDSTTTDSESLEQKANHDLSSEPETPVKGFGNVV